MKRSNSSITQAYRSIADLPSSTRQLLKAVVEDHRHLGEQLGQRVYMQTLNLDGLNPGDRSTVLSHLMAEAKASTRSNIERQFPDAPRWIVDPIIKAGVEAIDTGYRNLAKQDERS
ncbi:MAG: hypothetical protein GX970_02610 [Phyllobacteriaceae bacterium]|nr:hypothetical protein [Phyllobacteriaceae bacterium]